MIDLKKLERTNRSWIDPETGAEYRRLAGGLVWPDKGRHGFLILIGETWKNFDDREHHGLVEMPLETIKEALAKTAELPGEYFFTVMPPDLSDYVATTIYRNPGLATGRIINVHDQVVDGDATQFFSEIHREFDSRTKGGTQTVFLRDCPQTVGALQSKVPAGWEIAKEILAVPEVAALFYGLGSFFMWKEWPYFG